MDNPFGDFFKEMRDFMNRSQWHSFDEKGESEDFFTDIQVFDSNQPEQDQFTDIFSHFDNIFKSFGFLGPNFSNDFQLPSIEAPSRDIPQNPRDEMLKVPDSSQLVPKVPYTPNFSTGIQEDTDIDEQVNESGLLNLDIVKPHRRDNNHGSYFKSISLTTIRTPDGKVEERKTVKDSGGKIETTVRKILGDQSIETKTLRDQDGVQEKVENYVNIDENSVGDFLNKWKGAESKMTPQLSSPNEEVYQPRSFIELFKNIFKYPAQK